MQNTKLELILPSPIEELHDEVLENANIRLFVKRDDLIHPTISGNKWRKLKHHLIEFNKGDYDSIVTFGGAFSNHIHATAALGFSLQIKTIGIIRGEEHSPLNSTLNDAVKWGMKLKYISRSEYRNKDSSDLLNKLKTEFPNSYIIPEGGSGKLGALGCEDIVSEIDISFNTICCACGTATTLSGILNKLPEDKNAIGFPALKGGDFLNGDINTMSENQNYSLECDYHFKGYAKHTPELLKFMEWFHKTHSIQLDHVYTSKMFYGLYDLIKKEKLQNQTVIAIHTGGIQGVRGI